MNLSPLQSSPLLAIAPTAALGATFRLHRRDQIFPDVFDPHFPRTSGRAQILIAQGGATRPDYSAHSLTTNCIGRPIGEGLTNY